uniref:Uncharacterized protein n=1 Tax=Bartonella schoenbuchensis (strain DSM 13525 / NCTC 13165 / R1) TaxID=687861 RepID=E6Z0J5_BARSR|nr:hypothetical protein B11C_40490 [Bartonella schoenbuchensis R1]
MHTMLIYPDYLNNRDKNSGLCVFCPLVKEGGSCLS